MTQVKEWSKFTLTKIVLKIPLSADLCDHNSHSHWTSAWCRIWMWIGVLARCGNDRSARDSWHTISAPPSGQKCFSAHTSILRSYAQKTMSGMSRNEFPTFFIYRSTSYFAIQKYVPLAWTERFVERRKIVRARVRWVLPGQCCFSSESTLRCCCNRLTELRMRISFLPFTHFGTNERFKLRINSH